VTCAPSRHEDGSGPLGAIGEPSSQGDAVDPRSGATTWTFGVPLCVLDPAVPATLQSVKPTKSLGRYRLLGIKVRTFALTATNTPIVAIEGYPPAAASPVADPAGYKVVTACGGGPTADYTELLIGLGVEGSEGGGFEGVDVTYVAGGMTRTLHADFQLLICGPVVDDRCDGPPFTTANPLNP
jgi:hypothetical protein